MLGGWMGVYLGKNNLSIYFFGYVEYIDISDRSIYTQRYIDWSIYLFQFAIPSNQFYIFTFCC